MVWCGLVEVRESDGVAWVSGSERKQVEESYGRESRGIYGWKSMGKGSRGSYPKRDRGNGGK